MTSILSGALRFRLLVLAVAVGLLTVGVVHLRSAPVDVLPEFTPTYAEVQTEALGLSAEEVEQLITVPLEADLLNGVEGIETIRSSSVPGLSSIVMVFEPGTDVYRARLLVGERLTQAHALPNVSKPPTLLQPLSSSSRLVMIALSSEELTPIEQSVIARWTVRPRLMGVPGVANVAIWGMRDQQLQVQVDPARLRDNGVTLSQVISTAGNAQVVSPLTFLEASTPGTGGFIETPQQRLQVRHLLEKIADPAELGKVPVEGTDGRLQLSDVADVKVDHQPLIGDAVVAGEGGLMLVIEKFPGVDTRDVTAGVEDALEALSPGLTGMETDTSVFRPASYIDTAMDNLGLVLLLGFMLMLLALVALRFHWRAVLVAVVAVPLSLVVAALVLDFLGQGFNALVLAGLAAAVAVVVDEAVAPADHLIRRLRDRARGHAHENVIVTVRNAAAEVRGPLMFATAAVLLPVLPLAVLGGRPGAFFASLALSYAVAVASAVLVALTVTPALTAVVFSRWQPVTGGTQPSSRGRLGPRYMAGFQRFAATRVTAVLTAAGLALAGLAALPFLGLSPIPEFQDRNVLVRLVGEPGMSNTRMTEIATELGREVESLPGVAAVGAHVGRAITGDRVTNVNTSDIWVSIEPDADYDETMSAITETAQGASEVTGDVVAYSTQKMRDTGALMSGKNTVGQTGLSLLTGLEGGVGVRLYGQDPEILLSEAERVREAISAVDGVVDPQIQRPEVQPTVEIEVDLDRAQALGVTPGDVRRAEAALLQGIQVGSVFEEQKVFDVIVKGAPGIRGTVEDISNLLIDRPGGGHITLGQVADVRVADSAAAIERDAVSRRMDVTAQVSGGSVDDVAADIRRELAGMSFPMEYHAEVLQQSTSDEIATARVIGFAVAAALAAFLLLQAAFGSWRLAALAFAMVPPALAGGLLVVLATGRELTLGALLGLLAVLTLAIRTGTLVVRRIQSAWGAGFQPRAGESLVLASPVARGAGQSLAPVLASTFGLAGLALPAVVFAGRPGLEIIGPMAAVILGGLVTTTLVTLFVLPALYLHFVDGGSRGAVSEDDDAEPPSRRVPTAGDETVTPPVALPVGARPGGPGQ
jgi:Cu/Ag efflux pump CusA